MNWLNLILILLPVVFGVGYFLSMGKASSITWSETHTSNAKAIILIILGLIFINWLCANIGWHWWIQVKTKNETLFWITQLAIVYAFTVFKFTQDSHAKFFGWLILLVCVVGWFTVNDFTTDKSVQKTETLERISVEKGEIKQFRIDAIKKVIDASGIRDDVDFKYRIDNREWKTHVAHTPWRFNQRDNRVEITPIDFDLVVLEKRIVVRK